MKKVYHLLSVALLGAMALTSCEEDKIVNENNGEGNETDKNLTDYSFIASIKQSAPLGRSNLQNGVYTWNKEMLLHYGIATSEPAMISLSPRGIMTTNLTNLLNSQEKLL